MGSLMDNLAAFHAHLLPVVGGCKAKLPKKLLAPLEKAEGVPYIYAVAEDSNLYVLSAEDLTCAEVFYIGHFCRFFECFTF